MRVWDTFVVDTNNFAQAALYAADNNIEVVEGASGGALQLALRAQRVRLRLPPGRVLRDRLLGPQHGRPQHPDALRRGDAGAGDGRRRAGARPGPAAAGRRLLQQPRHPDPSNAPIGTWFRNSGTTQYGGHAHIVMPAVTGSAATGQASGAAGLVASYGASEDGRAARAERDQAAADDDRLGRRSPQNTVGPRRARPGAGRAGTSTSATGCPDLGLALERIDQGKIPPEALITVAGVVRAAEREPAGRRRDQRARLGQAHRRLHLQAPVGAGHRAGRGRLPGRERRRPRTTPLDGTLGTIDLEHGPRRARRARRRRRDRRPDRARQGPGRQGPERARLHRPRRGHGHRRQPRRGPQGAVRLPRHDAPPGLVAKDLGTGGEASPAPVRPRRRQQARHVLADSSGELQRAERRRHSAPELQRRPAGAARALPERPPRRAVLQPVDPPREVLRTPAIGDIDGDLEPEIVDSAGEHVYAWNADGTRRPRLPGAARPVLPPPAGPHARQPHQARLHRLADAGRPRRRLGARDRGARRSTSTCTPGTARATRCRASRSKLAGPDRRRARRSSTRAAVGDIAGDGRPEIVVPDRRVRRQPVGARRRPPAAPAWRLLATSSPTSSPTCSAAAGACTRSTATATCCPGWPIKPNGIVPDALPLVGPGVDHVLANVDADPQLEVIGNVATGDVTATNGDGSNVTSYDSDAAGRRARRQVEGAQPVREPDRGQPRRRSPGRRSSRAA